MPFSAANIALGSLLLSAGTSAAQFAGQKQRAEANAAAAEANFRAQRSREQARLNQQAERATQERLQSTKDAAKARSTVKTSAATAGVGGLSVESLLADFNRQEATISSRIARQQELNRQQSGARLNSLRAQRFSNKSRVSQPSRARLGLGLGSAALGAKATHLRLKDT